MTSLLTTTLVLHPCYKKRYFVRVRWPRDWVEKALSLLHTEWETRYHNNMDAVAEDSSSGPSHDANSVRQPSEGRPGGLRASTVSLALSIHYAMGLISSSAGAGRA